MNLKRYIDFINENDNLNKSISSMDKFGITDFRRLPIKLEPKLIEKGFKNSKKHEILDSTEESIFIKYLDKNKLLVEIYLNTVDDFGEPNQDTWVSVSFNYKRGEILLIGSVKRNEVDKLISLVEDLNYIEKEIIEIYNYESKLTTMKAMKIRENRLSKILEKYNIEVDYSFAQDKISENLDNIKKSERGLDMFGMTNYDALPEDLKKKAIELGWKNDNIVGYSGISDKSIYSKDLEIEGVDASYASVYVAVDDLERFSKDSQIVFAVDIIHGEVDFLIELHRDRYDFSDIETAMNNVDIIVEKTYNLINDYTAQTAGDLLKQIVVDIGITPTEKDIFNSFG